MASTTNIERQKIAFNSGKDTCRGYLYMPKKAAKPFPCVILGHGFTGTQDRLQGNAEYFASNGIAALTFDYRNFGESTGQPRQVIKINNQLEDFKNAISFAAVQTAIDPAKIALWGSSLGGGHVISVAAQDPRVAAVVAQVPFNGFPKKVEGRTKQETNRLLSAMFKDIIRGWLHLKPLYIKAVGRPGELAVMASKEAEKTIEAMNSEQWQNKVAPRALFDMMRYKPGRTAHLIQVPVMVCVGKYDKETLGTLAKQLATGPKAELHEYPVAHFDFYRPDIRKQVLEDQAAFLVRNLI